MSNTGRPGDVVLVTGCSSGIGYHVALRLKEEGYEVYATARDQADVDRLREQSFEALRLDYDSSESIREATGQLLEATGGRIFGLFNNGAYGQLGAVEDLSTDVLKAQFETNFFGWHELTRKLLPSMRRAGRGRIIQNSSVLGLVVMKYKGAYSASKFAIEGLSDAMRQELKGSGVFVSLVEPGPIESRFRENAYQMLKTNIDLESSPHRNVYSETIRRLESGPGPTPPFTLSPEAVYRKVRHALESPRPKARYYVTVPTHFFALFRRALPTSILDRILIAAAGAEHRQVWVQDKAADSPDESGESS